MGISFLEGDKVENLIEILEAANHLQAHLNAGIDLLVAEKRASAIADVGEVARLCGNGEILEVMGYGDQIAPAWSEGETNYNPAMNLVHDGTAELEDGETIRGTFFEWDKTTPTGVPIDAPEAIYCCDGNEGLGDHYITIGAVYGEGWLADAGIQISFSVAPLEDDQLVISLGADNKINPTAGRTWTLYEAGTTNVRDSGTTSSGKNGTELGSTHPTDPQRTNGRVNAPSRAVYGYNRWSQSALRQWLNGTGAIGTWWKKQNPWDRPPGVADTLAGFLSGYSADVYKNFKPIKVQTVACNADDNVVDVTYDRVFLASLEQMYCVPQFAGQEGEYWEYYKRLLGRTSPAPTSKTYARLIKYGLNAPTSAQHCFRRSASRTVAHSVWYVNSSGSVQATTAYDANRCAPSVFLSN